MANSLPENAIQPNNSVGIWLMVATMIVFAAQDGLSRHLADAYSVQMVVMVRFWFFAAFVIAISARKRGGLRAVMATKQPALQVFRGALLALEVCVMIFAFTVLGLVESMAIFAMYPLMVAALSGPILGETVGWRRWIAIFIGFCGVIIILAPGRQVFSPAALIPVASATMFALYALLTRYASRRDSADISFFWTGVVGAIVMTGVGIWFWEPMTQYDSLLMAMLCVSGVLGHWLLIKVYEIAEASAVQPFAYLHVVFAAAVGIVFFQEELKANVAIGVCVVMSAGVFTLLRGAQKKR